MSKASIKRRLKNESGFTMLELLVVVGILAIIGGAMIAAYDGVESQAAKATSTNTLASVDNSVRGFVVTEKALPNNLESLLAGDPTSLHATEDDSQGISVVDVQAAASAFAGHLGSKLAGKFTITALTQGQLDALNAAGITMARYIHNDGNGTGTGGASLDIIENGAGIVGNGGVGDIAQIDIPAHGFEAPRPGTTRNRGRGYPKLLALNDEVAVWTNPDGFNNRKVGAGPNDILIGFGIGNASTLVGVDNNSVGGIGNVRLTSAPFYGDVAKNEYPHYVMLVNVGPLGSEFTTAKLTAILDSRGDFLDEEFAESTGQKQ